MILTLSHIKLKLSENIKNFGNFQQPFEETGIENLVAPGQFPVAQGNKYYGFVKSCNKAHEILTIAPCHINGLVQNCITPLLMHWSYCSLALSHQI